MFLYDKDVHAINFQSNLKLTVYVLFKTRTVKSLLSSPLSTFLAFQICHDQKHQGASFTSISHTGVNQTTGNLCKFVSVRETETEFFTGRIRDDK